MSKEKQIEEIRKDIFAAFGGYAKWEEDWKSLAEAVYNAGYRKQSEWISVADSRKPHNLQKCFIAYVFGDSDMIFYGEARYHAFEGNGLVDRPHFSNEGVEGMTVKYWMPIPRFLEMKGGAE